MLKLCPQSIEILLPCEPFKVEGNETKGEELHIRFEPSGTPGRCPRCGDTQTIHAWRRIRLDGPPTALHRRTVWDVRYRVCKCDFCEAYNTEPIPFRFGNTHCTTYLAKLICEDLSGSDQNIRSVGRRYGLSWDRVKGVHREYLTSLKALAPEPDPPEVCVVDEFAVERNHRYATLVIDAETKLPLYLHKGNAAKDFEPFFSLYGNDFYDSIKAFAMDQNASYSSVVGRHLPSCTVVCDYFHIMKNYSEQVTDGVRRRTVRQFLKLGRKESAQRIGCSARLLNRRFPSDDGIDDEDDWSARLMLKAMMEENHDLDVCIHMRERLQHLYDDCRDVAAMGEGWRTWCDMAMQSGVPELVQFAMKKRKLREQEIVNHALFPVSFGVIEGCMNKIKVLKRISYGLRDYDYFFLRIWQAFLPYETNRTLSDKVWNSYECTSCAKEDAA